MCRSLCPSSTPAHYLSVVLVLDIHCLSILYRVTKSCVVLAFSRQLACSDRLSYITTVFSSLSTHNSKLSSPSKWKKGVVRIAVSPSILVVCCSARNTAHICDVYPCTSIYSPCLLPNGVLFVEFPLILPVQNVPSSDSDCSQSGIFILITPGSRHVLLHCHSSQTFRRDDSRFVHSIFSHLQ